MPHHLHHHFVGLVGDWLGSHETAVGLSPPAFVDRLARVKPVPGAHSDLVTIRWQLGECALGCVQWTITGLDTPQGEAAGSVFPQRATAPPWPASVAAAALHAGRPWDGSMARASSRGCGGQAPGRHQFGEDGSRCCRAWLRGRYTHKPQFRSQMF